MVFEKHLVLVACFLVLERGKRILLLRRFNTGYKDGKYSLVAGHIEKSETAREAMKREAKEEVGINIDLKDMNVVHIMQRKSSDREYVDFYLTAKKWRGRPRNMEPDKCDGLRWFGTKKLPKNIVEYIPVAIKKIGSGEFYSEYGF